MGTTVTYPDGTQLVSTALSVDDIDTILQQVTLGMWGKANPNGTIPADSDLVRIGWPKQGQPFVDSPDIDVCFLRCTTKDDAYDKIRDKFSWGPNGWGDAQFGKQPYGGTLSGDPALTEQWTYTRVWEIHWCFYGPNAVDNTRLIRSGLYQDYFTDLLSIQANLFPMSEFEEAHRVPELIDGQWWERSDFKCEMYEFVSETINRQTIVEIPLIVQTIDVIIDNTEVIAVGYGAGPYGQQPYGK